MGEESSFLRLLAEEHPAILAALIGGGTGATIGGLNSEDGSRGEGALKGALLGGTLGAAGGAAGRKFKELSELMTPSTSKALAIGGVAGGFAGGHMAKSTLSPWIRAKLEQAGLAKEQKIPPTEKKEASVMSNEKQALEKEAAERMTAFDFGMDTFLAENNIDKAEFCKAAGLEHPGMLAPATIEWLNAQTEEKK